MGVDRAENEDQTRIARAIILATRMGWFSLNHFIKSLYYIAISECLQCAGVPCNKKKDYRRQFSNDNITVKMEDYEDYEPDNEGSLELRYLGWSSLEPKVLQFANRLLCLDISFNQLPSIPREISSLAILTELDISCNKLQSLPSELSSLSWLRILKANGNQLCNLPQSLGQLKKLETINLSENLLTSIPQEIAGCSSLQTVLLQNNDLKRLPLSLSALELKQLDVSNNNQALLSTLPAAIHSDANSILWILRLQQEKSNCIENLKQDIKLLQRENMYTEQQLTKAKDQVSLLQEKKTTLEQEMDSVRTFLTLRNHYREFRLRLSLLWQECKRAWQLRQVRDG